MEWLEPFRDSEDHRSIYHTRSTDASSATGGEWDESRTEQERRDGLSRIESESAMWFVAMDTARGTAEASISEARGRADAAVIASRGDAEAGSTEARGKAEAAGIAAQAEAYEKFNQAAILSKVLEVLPAMAREIAAPMSAIDTMTVVSNDGASQLSRNVTSGVHQTTQMVKDTTGLDIIALLGDLLKNADKPGQNGAAVHGSTAD